MATDHQDMPLIFKLGVVVFGLEGTVVDERLITPWSLERLILVCSINDFTTLAIDKVPGFRSSNATQKAEAHVGGVASMLFAFVSLRTDVLGKCLASCFVTLLSSVTVC